MERIYLKHPMIKKLETEIKSNNYNALNEFYRYMEENKEPLVMDFDDNYSVVTLIYKGKEDTKNVVLIPPVGMRNLTEHVLENLDGTTLWYISYKVRNDISFSYHFSENDPLDNDWDRRWRNSKGDVFNKHYTDFSPVQKQGVVKRPLVILKDSKKKIYIKERNDVKKGTIKEIDFKSKILNKVRKVRIYLPFDYDSNKEKCNILLLNDGEEYIKLLNAATVLDNLIYDKKIKRTIGVFVDSTEDRGEDYKCSDKFAQFLATEIIPYIKENYNASKKAGDCALGGYSLGGLISSYSAFLYGNVFGNVISMSGSYWYNKDSSDDNEIYMSRLYGTKEKQPINFYINVGSIEPEKSMKDTNYEFKDKLEALGYEVYFEEFGSGHDYIWWGETLAYGLLKLFKL